MFASLHAHSEYSLLDGFASIKEMAARAEECNYSALAITDHGNMFAAVPFFNALSKTSVKPIIGIEAYFFPGNAKERQKTKHNASHIILLAETDEGLRNLFQLSSRSYSEGFYYKPRIDPTMLAEHSKGLIVLTACVGGCLNCHVLDDDYPKAVKVGHVLLDILGKDHLFIEYQNHPLAKQEKANAAMEKIQKELGVKGAFTLDSHYAYKEDSDAHNAMVCIGTGKQLIDTDRLSYHPNEFYMKSADEVAELTTKELLQSTMEIAERCNAMPNSGHLVPKATGNLRDRTIAGMDSPSRRQAIADNCKRIGIREKEYIDRVKMELTTIETTGFGGYFLCIADMVGWGKAQGIEISDGRGSVGGSLVAYLLGITEIDPLRYDLSFERFLNPQRISMPDIDIDIEQSRHQEFINHVRQVYGADCVARLATYQKIRARSSVKDVGRVMGVPIPDVVAMTNSIPQSGKETITIDSAMEISKEFRQKAMKNKKLVELAAKIEGRTRHVSLHASGYAIAPNPVTNYLPTFVPPKGDLDETAVQADMKVAESVGIVKFDFLTLTTLDIIGATKRSIGKEIDIPLDDEETFKMLQEGKTEGVFQLSTSLMQHVITAIKPSNIEGLALVSAVGRPGAKQALEMIIACKQGKAKPKYPHPLLIPVLEETYGGFVYQEQLMKSAMVLADFSMAEADILRKACGKKDVKLMSEQRNKFIRGCLKKGLTARHAEKIFSILADFAAYGFNKAHAVAYAVLSYKTAYLKKHYPAHFVAACLSHARTTNFFEFMHLAYQCDVEILPPAFRKSKNHFVVEMHEGKEAVRYGLTAVKGIGDKTLEAIKKAESMEVISSSFEEVEPKIVVSLDHSMNPADIDEWEIPHDPEGYPLLFEVTLKDGNVATIVTERKTRIKTVVNAIGEHIKWNVRT